MNRLLKSRVDGFIIPVNDEASPIYFKEVVDRSALSFVAQSIMRNRWRGRWRVE